MRLSIEPIGRSSAIWTAWIHSRVRTKNRGSVFTRLFSSRRQLQTQWICRIRSDSGLHVYGQHSPREPAHCHVQVRRLIFNAWLIVSLILSTSNTFDRLQNDTDRIWKFQRYSLICEYLARPALPPPLIFFSHLWRVALWALSHCIKSSCIINANEKHNNRTRYSKDIWEDVDRREFFVFRNDTRQ